MFPFNLNGPSFLVFYAAYAAMVLLMQWAYSRAGEDRAGSRGLNDLTADPYRIAYLRDAVTETVRLAVVNLVDRNLLSFEGTSLRATKTEQADFLRRPLDRAIIFRCASPAAMGAVLDDAKVRAACAEYEQDLVRKGLLLDDEQRHKQRVCLLVVLLLLGGVAAARIVQTLSHGGRNFLYLIALAAVACWVAYRIYPRRTSAAGSRALTSLKTLMQRLKGQVGRIAAGGATNEALLLAAVFGIYALPFPFIEQIFPKPRQSDSGGSSDSGYGSSCSSDSGGGGGCGGGGGGCGGGGD